MNSYYETLGLIYECYDEGYISEDTKDTLKEKLKEARDKAEEKLSKAKEFAKKHKKALAAAGLGATALSGGAVVANNKLNKDFDINKDKHKNAYKAYKSIANDERVSSRTQHGAGKKANEEYDKFMKYANIGTLDDLRGLKARLKGIKD